MRLMDKFRLRVRSLFRRRDVERELGNELGFHLDQLVDEAIAAGAKPDDARRLALDKIGGLTQIQEECRDMRRVNLVNDLVRDLRYGVRNLNVLRGAAA
jgi:putative ABC transport system permease protein